MQVKVCHILVIAMVMLMVVMPASAYDYRGVPRPGENSPESVDEEIITEDVSSSLGDLDLTALLDSPEISSLIMLIISFFLQLFSGTYS